MKMLSVGELKRTFSDVLHSVKQGEVIAVQFGRKHEIVAMLVPINKYKPAHSAKRKLGLLASRAGFKIKAGFKMTDQEFLSS